MKYKASMLKGDKENINAVNTVNVTFTHETKQIVFL